MSGYKKFRDKYSQERARFLKLEEKYAEIIHENRWLREENRRLKQQIKDNLGVDIDAWEDIKDDPI